MDATSRLNEIRLCHGRFDFDRDAPDIADIWNIAPIWPGRDKAKLSLKRLLELLDAAWYRTDRDGHLILWMPSSELHRAPIDPTRLVPWRPQGTVISGSFPLHIGYIFSKGKTSPISGTKLILDERGKRGVSSSLTVKYLLEALRLHPKTLIFDPYAHKSAILPMWCRRLGFQYLGYIASKSAFKSATKRLAQIELPGIQLEVPSTEY